MTVRSEVKGNVCTVIVSRPEARNAYDRPTAAALVAALQRFEADDSLRCCVLYGDGGNFCAGADLKAIGDQDRSLRLEAQGHGPMGVSRMKLSKPLIAAVAGYAVAGGLEVSLLADIRVAEDSAVFGVFCRRFGVPLIDGGTVRLPRIVGRGNALHMILTGAPVSAGDALRMGLVTKVVKDGTVREEAEKIAHSIAAMPQLCMLNDRRSVYEGESMSFDDAMRNEFRRGLHSIQSGSLADVAKFIAGEGRHGAFHDSKL